MTDILQRFTAVSDAFGQRVSSVADSAWGNPSPCEGWAARDIVRHVVEWMPAFLETYADLTIPAGPSVDEDPVKAWTNLQAAVSRALADPEVATREFDSPPGRMSLEQAIDMMFTGDLLVHTWDLARATGLDETLDAHHVHRMFAGMEPYDEMLRTSGHYGPRVAVADDADEQTKFIAFMGRNP
jgi:uncharacterized protein (TIGR03086 family)